MTEAKQLRLAYETACQEVLAALDRWQRAPDAEAPRHYLDYLKAQNACLQAENALLRGALSRADRAGAWGAAAMGAAP